MQGQALRAVRRNASLRARVVRTLPLRYDDGPDALTGRPGHVRAGSSLVAWSEGLGVVQDDANFLAVVELGGEKGEARVRAVALPADATGRRLFDERSGTKAAKMDLEAAVALDGETVALIGSGSTVRRDRIAVVGKGGSVRVVDAHALYESFRALKEFSGSELNIEGATRVSDVLRFFNRKNGAPKGQVLPVNASCDVSWPLFLGFLAGKNEAPVPTNAVQYDLGQLGGVDLGFTDATTVGGRVFFSGSAENSASATEDGAVTGSVVGFLNADGSGGEWIEVTDATGGAFRGKIEGLVVKDDLRTAYAVVDCDSYDTPSDLLFLQLDKAW